MTHARISPRTRAAAIYHYEAVIRTYRTHSPAEQAALLGLSRDYILKLRSRAIQEQRVTPRERVYQPTWSDADDRRLVALLRAGWSIPRISAALQRPQEGIYTHILDRGESIDSIRAGHVWTLNQLMALFAVSYTTVAGWMRRRWLPLQRNAARGSGPNIGYLITRDHLHHFVQLRTAWPTYDPADITDVPLRTTAQAARRFARGHWEKVGDWAERRGYARRYGVELARSQERETQVLGTTMYIWIPDEEAHL